MSLVILRHCQDRDHCDTSLLAILTPCSFIQCCKVCVQISRISTTSRNFLSGCGYLTQCICVVCDICQNNKDMHILFKCKIFRCCQRHTWCCDTLNRRVIRKVYKQYCSVECSCLTEAFDKEVRLLESNTHSSKYNRKVFICSKYLCLTGNLCCQLCMRQTRC